MKPISFGISIALTAVASALTGPAAVGQQYTQIVVFGDSLSDVGNIKSRDGIPVSPPYFEGRASNGPNWVDYLAGRLQLPRTVASETGGFNYAWAAATTGSVPSNFVPDLNGQITTYLRSNTPQPTDLFLVWAGGNDPIFGQTNGRVAARAVRSNARRLLQEGASHLLAPNLPDRSGLEPYGVFGLDFNDELRLALGELRSEFPNANIVELDYLTLQLSLERNSGVYGFSETHLPACRDCSSGEALNPTDIVASPDEHMFWDDAHPTTKTHQFIGHAAWSRLLNPAGDFDQDGAYGEPDITLMQEAVRLHADRLEYDTDGNWLLSEDDVDFWIHNLANTYFGDANLDGEFNSSDFTLVFLAGEYEDTIEDNSGWAEGDWDGDGDFTSGDFVTAFLDGGYEQGPHPAGAIPEPTGCVLLAIGALACGLHRHRRVVSHSRNR